MEGDPGGNAGESASTPRRRRRLIVLAAAAVLGSLLTWSILSKPPVIEAVTPDGKFIVQFHAASVGSLNYRSHSALYVQLHKLARDFFPVGLFRRLPVPRTASHQGQSSRTGAPPLLMLFSTRPVDPTSRDRSQILMETSFTFDEPTGFQRDTMPATRTISGFGEILSFEDFPRRDRRLTVRLTDRNTGKTFMTVPFKIDLQDFPEPSWTHAPTPIEKRSPELKCTLTGFAPFTDPKLGAHPVIEINPVSPSWSEYSSLTTIEDATGNWSPSLLSPFEAAWRVRLNVHRTIAAQFESGDFWQGPAIAVPGDNLAANIDAGGQIGATAVSLLAVKGPGRGVVEKGVVENKNGQWMYIGSGSGHMHQIAMPAPTGGGVQTFHNISMPATEKPFLLMHVDDLAPEDHLLVLIRDQDGEILGKAVNPKTRFAKTHCRAAIEFTPRRETTEVIPTIIISRPRVFEFDVEPPAELRAKYAKAVPK